MTFEIVDRIPVAANSKYDTRILVNALRANRGSALKVDVAGLKFVNFHSCVYKMCKSEGLTLHYRLSGTACYFWID